ncbi:hypothetical protein [uncultured Methylobacterium sp.]|jgi:hypothetical protein|uniref:hypothetical protein n=1 Tax=uncultured Methylobacterium sp. TaxID=157278 RepID=UPI00262A155C|nr:hypothetical protein [uncultured Methylobacterium sp.]
MTPVARCLRRFDLASVRTDSTIVALVEDALDELEAAFDRPSERIVALEAVLHETHDRQDPSSRAFSRFLLTMIDRRQVRLAAGRTRDRHTRLALV